MQPVLARLDPRLMIVLGAVVFSTGGAAVKAVTLDGWQVAALRSGIAFVALLVLVPSARAGFTLRTVPVAIAYATTLVLFVLANKLTTAANTIFLQSTAPLYLLFLGPLLLRESIRSRDLWFMTALAAGIALFFIAAEPPSAMAPNPKLGNVLGALAGVSWALTLLGLRWLARFQGSGSAASASALGNLFAFAAGAYFAFPVTSVTSVDWLILLYLGVVQIGIAYALLTAAMNRVTAFEASLLILVEPALNPVWAWLVHGERVAPLAALGGVIIILSTVLRTLQQRRDGRPGAGTDGAV